MRYEFQRLTFGTVPDKKTLLNWGKLYSLIPICLNLHILFFFFLKGDKYWFKKLEIFAGDQNKES